MMSWFFVAIIALSILFSFLCGTFGMLTNALTQGAQKGVELTFSIAGALCLWSGVGRLLEASGLTAALAKLLRPFLIRIFPSAAGDKALAGAISGNICANLLGLGNAATPMGIRAVQRMKAASKSSEATDEMCRLIVLNTASIQLIPSTVAALRSATGCASPFDILPAVWLTSIASAGLGLGAAYLLGRLARRD